LNFALHFASSQFSLEKIQSEKGPEKSREQKAMQIRECINKTKGAYTQHEGDEKMTINCHRGKKERRKNCKHEQSSMIMMENHGPKRETIARNSDWHVFCFPVKSPKIPISHTERKNVEEQI